MMMKKIFFFLTFRDKVWAWIKAKIRWILISVGIVGVALAGGTVIQPKPITPDLQLKVPKDRVLWNKTVDDVRCNDSECASVGQMKKYWYATENKVERQTDSFLGNDWSEDMSKRDYNKFVFKNGDKRVSAFIPQVQMTKDLSTGEWFNLEQATTTIDAFEEQTKVSLLDRILPQALAGTSGPFYPDEDAESTTVDGFVKMQENPGTWTSVITSGTGTGINDDSARNSFIISRENDGDTNRFYCDRGFLLFDVSGDADVMAEPISSSTLSIFRYSGNDQSGDGYIRISSSTPASATGLVNADYDQVGRTSFAQKNLASMGVQYYHFTMNSDGITHIQDEIDNNSGIIRFGAREKRDLEAEEPLNGYNNFNISYSEQTGTSEDPYLYIEWGAAAAAGYTAPQEVIGSQFQ